MNHQAVPMSAQEIARAVIDRKSLFILDVRNADAYADWKIEGTQINSINVPYFELLEGVESVLPLLPDNSPVLVVCAKEGSSKFVAEQLVDAGRDDVHYLEGGMKAWSEHLEPVKVGDLKDGGELYQFVRLGKGCLSYMVLSDGEAAVVDTLRMTEVFEKFAKEKGARIKHTLDTHLHADHISGGRKLAEESGADYWLPPKDADEVVFSYNPLEDGQTLTVGNTEIAIQPVYSPGHTIGSTSLVVDDQYLLSGDILFVASIGRPDLAGKAGDWAGDLRSTLYETYRSLSEELTVLPAHFGQLSELGEDGRVSAKLGDLYANNPGLNMEEETTFRQAVTTNLPSQPNAYQEIRRTNMGLIQPDDEEQREMEIGPNRCAIHDK
nr:MBL fold metallo-hydrolase [Cohnella mopanensis]